MSNTGKIKPRKKMNAIILCGGAITKAEIETVFTGALQRVGLVIVGAYYGRSHSHCCQLARKAGITTTREIGELLTLRNVDMIIDFTGDEELIKRVCESKPPHARLMDHVSSRILLYALRSGDKQIDFLTGQVDKLKQEADNYWGLFDNAVAALFRTRISDGALIMCNSKLADILGYDCREDVIRSYNVANNYVNPLKRIELLHLLATEGMVNSFEFQQRRVNGTIFWADLSARYFPDNDYLEGITSVQNRF
jgi:PAS domain-containing protein